MPEEVDWQSTTFEGNRLRQMRAFAALPLREKLERVEQMGEMHGWFDAQKKKSETELPRTKSQRGGE